jgi:hypothetical protein
VAWNPDHQSWDLKLRRGALGEALLCLVVEHHGGPRRLARFSADIRPNQAISWALGILAFATGAAAALELTGAALVLATLLGVLSVATIREADRLEVGIRAATDEICDHPSPALSDSAAQHPQSA